MPANLRLRYKCSLMPHQLRCPACGQVRPERAFAGAGTHRLEALQLRGRGQGRGFERVALPMTLAMLGFLGERLDRARAQVAQLAEQVYAAAQPVIMCPGCGWAACWSPNGWHCPRCGIDVA